MSVWLLVAAQWVAALLSTALRTHRSVNLRRFPVHELLVAGMQQHHILHGVRARMISQLGGAGAQL
jgi:hypothetical protein